MRVSQVANRDLPSKPLRWTKALRRQSCTASCASSRFRVIRWATRKTLFAWRSQSSPKGALFPVLAAAINCSSLHSRSSLTAEALLCAESNVVIAKTAPPSNRSLQPCQDLFPQPSSLSIHWRTYAGQFSSFMPSVWHPLESSLRRDPFVFIFHSPVPIGTIPSVGKPRFKLWVALVVADDGISTATDKHTGDPYRTPYLFVAPGGKCLNILSTPLSRFLMFLSELLESVSLE